MKLEIRVLKVGIHVFCFSRVSSSFVRQSSQRDDDNVEELTTCKKWRWLETVDLLDSFLNSTSTSINESAVRILTVVALTSWSLSRNSRLLLHSLFCFSLFNGVPNGWRPGRVQKVSTNFNKKMPQKVEMLKKPNFLRLLGDLYQDCYIFSRGFL